MKRRFLFLMVGILAPGQAWAAGFVATVGSDHVGLGKSFALQLTLSGVEAKRDPDIGGLKQSFTIVSESQSSSIIGINGVTSSKVSWVLTLIAKRAGHLTLPSIAIETEAGVLRTAAVALEVDQDTAPPSSRPGTGASMVSLAANVSTATPFQNQSIQYTVRGIIRGNISDVSLGDMNVSNAIVEQQGKPDVYGRVENGTVVRVAEFHYIVTPLQPGKITIPPFVLKGKIATPDLAADSFGGGISSGMRQALNFFSAFAGEPFSAASGETVLHVKPPAAAMDPWLPLTSLKIIEDEYAARPVRIGEPLTRKITLLADGAVGSQLPDLEAQQDHRDFKVYADKPTMGEDIDKKNGVILGWRKESYNLLAQKAGTLVLPAIRVGWWDIVNHRAATAELPERIVTVLPAPVAPKSPVLSTGAATHSAHIEPSRAKIAAKNAGSILLYCLISTMVLIFLAFRGLKLWRKIQHSMATAEPTPKTAKPELKAFASRAVSDRTLEDVHTAEDLKTFLQTYAHARRGASENAPLEQIFSVLSRSWTAPEADDVEVITKSLTAALYAGGAIDVEDLKSRCRRILAGLKRRAKDSPKGGEKLPRLNPT